MRPKTSQRIIKAHDENPIKTDETKNITLGDVLIDGNDLVSRT